VCRQRKRIDRQCANGNEEDERGSFDKAVKNLACVAVKKDPCVGSTEEQEERVCPVKIRVSDRF